MIEYEQHIQKYSSHCHQYTSCLVPELTWGNKTAAASYLKKFWLPLVEYEHKWKLLQDNIFISQNWKTGCIFPNKYEILAFRGGCLFLKKDFEELQQCFLDIGDKHFFVIENTFDGKYEVGEPSFRMKYPSNISWDELTSGNFISAIIIEFFNKEFFVFGESVAWGRYSASSCHLPVDLLGFRPMYSSLFREKLNQPERERLEVAAWLPPQYRERML